MKAKQIFEGTQAIRILLGEKFSPKASYSIARLSKKLEEEFKLIEEARVVLVKQYGKENADGGFSLSQEDQISFDTFMAEFNQVLDANVDFEFIPLDIDQLGSTLVTPALLAVLDPFIKVPE
jgi:hypothetical protein